MYRVGIICCKYFWKEGCPGYKSHTLCFLAAEKKQGPLGELGEFKIVTMKPCPGCPGTGRIKLAYQMIKNDKIDHIVFPSCLFFNNHCSTASQHAAIIEEKTGRPVLMGSYVDADKARSSKTVITKPDNIPSLTECHQHLLNLSYLNYLYKKNPVGSRSQIPLQSFLRMA
ncbi:MAG: hypothetical protein PWP31_572 [Clostridia bacterium]|nr:hypothetical protein [Clostridia bacterium]